MPVVDTVRQAGIVSLVVFINYRRSDCQWFAGRLYDWLAAVYIGESLFIDVDTLDKGTDFVRGSKESVRSSDVVLVLIGDAWLAASDEGGRRRLDLPNDVVREEIEEALRSDKIVIPVLIDQASMPEKNFLPPSIQPLTRRNAVSVCYATFRADILELCEAINQAVNNSAKRKARLEKVARDTGISTQNLRRIFDAAEQEFSPETFEAAARAAIDDLLTRATMGWQVFTDGNDVRATIEGARQKLRDLDVPGSVDHLRKARAEEVESPSARMRAAATLAKEEAAILRSAIRWTEAIEAFQTASRLDRDDAWVWFEIGEIRLSRANLPMAENAFGQAMLTAQRVGNHGDLSICLSRIGDVRRAQDRIVDALKDYREALDITERLAVFEPQNPEWQQRISVLLVKIDAVQKSQTI